MNERVFIAKARRTQKGSFFMDVKEEVIIAAHKIY